MRRHFSGREVAKVLVNEWGFVPVGGRGDHRKFRYENPDTGEVRIVTVPLHDPINIGTLRNIAKQAGAKDFDKFCDQLDYYL